MSLAIKNEIITEVSSYKIWITAQLEKGFSLFLKPMLIIFFIDMILQDWFPMFVTLCYLLSEK